LKNILFLVPDSTGIRNYLFSDICTHLKKDSNIHLWSPISINVFKPIESKLDLIFIYQYLFLPNEPLLGKWLRETITYARLLHNSAKVSNPTIMQNWKHNKKKITKYIINQTHIVIGSILSKFPSLFTLLDKYSNSFWPQHLIADFERKLKAASIDRVIITHQRVVNLMPICLAARNLGIEIISVIYSWDNLPKARLHVVADKYLVWSDYMKAEMATYYPEIPSSKVIVTGTPQFEFYANKKLLVSRQVFAERWGLDAKKQWILYSGGDTLTSPYDQDYLDDMLLALAHDSNILVIFRRSPADFSPRFDHVIEKYKGLLFSIDPLWKKGESWSSNIPQIEDFALLTNLAHHCTLAVNVGSTIAHDFAIFDKPTIYINYEQNNSSHWSIKTINAFQHFRSMPSPDAVVWLNGKDEWKVTIQKTIQNPKEMASKRLLWYNNINLTDETSASLKIANILLQ
jgi:hypothetical protein